MSDWIVRPHTSYLRWNQARSGSRVHVCRVFLKRRLARVAVDRGIRGKADGRLLLWTLRVGMKFNAQLHSLAWSDFLSRDPQLVERLRIGYMNGKIPVTYMFGTFNHRCRPYGDLSTDLSHQMSGIISLTDACNQSDLLQ